MSLCYCRHSVRTTSWTTTTTRRIIQSTYPVSSQLANTTSRPIFPCSSSNHQITIRTLSRFRSKKQGNRRKMTKAKPTPTAFMEPIHVLGGGSIGMLVASSIRTAFPSYPITLLLRPHHEKHLEPIGNRFRATISVQSPATAVVTTTPSFKDDDNGNDTVPEGEEEHKQGTSPPGGGPQNRVRMVTVPVELITDSNTTTTTKQKKKMKPIRNLLLATKAPDAPAALQSILPRLDPQKTVRIIILCNGALAVQEAIEKVMEEHTFRLVHAHKVKIILASTTHGAYQEVDDHNNDNNNHNKEDEDDDMKMYHLVHAGMGQTFIENEPVLTKMLDRSGLVAKSISTSEVFRLMWYKLATNCSINPMTALLQCENGHLSKYLPEQQQDEENNDGNDKDTTTSIRRSSSSSSDLKKTKQNDENDDKEDEHYRTLIKQVIEEISLVGIAETGYKTALQTDALQSFVRQVIQDTAQNKSSMLQDVLNKKPTEIDYLNGYVVKLGQKHNIDTPANQMLMEQIQQLTESYTKK